MKTTCKICGIVDKPHKCPYSKRKTDRSRYDNKVYESKEYRVARGKTIVELDNLCMWSLYVEGKIVKATHTHHIIEVLEDESRATDKSNLITLTKANHELVHYLYKINPDVRKDLKEFLFFIKNEYVSGRIQYGKYKKRFSQYTPHL